MSAAQNALDTAFKRGGLVVCPAVFAELMPGILASESIGAYAEGGNANPGPRRVPADFLIGAHALLSARHLLTLDDHFYKAAFPGLSVAVP
jgi:hypothetical protein